MKVEIDSLEDVPKEFLAFVQVVSERENLHNWTLIVWELKGEAECITDMKLIYMAVKPDVEQMKAWFIHEVSHATFEMQGGSPEDSIHHRELWKGELLRLLKYYLPNISQKTTLGLKEIE